MKIGDKVRFLSEIGGGRVAGFQGKNVVLVEDEDGFEVPMAISEVVVIGVENYDTSHVLEVKQKSQQQAAQPNEVEPADRPVTFKAKPEERKGGEELSAYLAFVPMDVKELSQTRFETYLVNDCNYYIRFSYLTAEGSGWSLRATAEVEPNTKLFIEEFGREDLNGMERVAIQLMAYKRDKNFLLRPTVDVQLRIDPVKFYKLHTFLPNAYFEQPSLVYTIIENGKAARPLVVDARQLKEEMYGRQIPVVQDKRQSVTVKDDGTIVVDLHADALLDTTNGMSASDILNYQLDAFRKVLKDNEKKKGTKIVFIHGKGEGVLRKALVNELQYRYKHYTYQDASFQEYSYGATQVTIK
ncbi:MAG: DUF2027 domain-containing protein [Prevotella sp.]|nr:DUF2027 domain-containing protein [Prevotella sp.]